VIAAAAAKGNKPLLILGLAIGIPCHLRQHLDDQAYGAVSSSWCWARVIGWVGGETIVSDAALKDFLGAQPWLHYVAAAVGTAFVVGLGKMLQSRGRMKTA
jgi:hypothetical protein